MSIAEMTDEQIQTTFQNAREASKTLRKTSVAERAHALHTLIDYINDNRETIADAIVAETKKTRTDAVVSEVMGALDNLEWLLEQAPKVLAPKKVTTHANHLNG